MDPEFLGHIGNILHAVGWAFLPVTLLPIVCLVFKNVQLLNRVQYALIQTIDTINLSISEAVKWLLVLMVVTIAIGVVALSIFGQSWTKLDESATYFHAIVILLGSAATFLAGKHVRVDIFYTKMSTQKKALVDLIGFYALLIPFCIVIIWNAQATIGLSWLSYEGSPESDGIRGVYLLKTCVSIFAVQMLMQGIANTGRAVFVLNGDAQPALPKYIAPLFQPQTSTHEEAQL